MPWTPEDIQKKGEEILSHQRTVVVFEGISVLGMEELCVQLYMISGVIVDWFTVCNQENLVVNGDDKSRRLVQQLLINNVHLLEKLEKHSHPRHTAKELLQRVEQAQKVYHGRVTCYSNRIRDFWIEVYGDGFEPATPIPVEVY